MGKVLILIIAALIIEMLNPTISKEFLQTNKKLPASSPTPVATQQPSSSPSPLTTPQPTATPQLTNLQKFNYPNSKIISSNGSTLILESSDNTTAITAWYKNQIKTNDMKATSFVETNTNGDILNKLAGGDYTKKVTVEIKKDSNQIATKITVNLAFK